jgi:hypothetical protein
MKAMHLFFFVSESMGVKEASVNGRVNNAYLEDALCLGKSTLMIKERRRYAKQHLLLKADTRVRTATRLLKQKFTRE